MVFFGFTRRRITGDFQSSVDPIDPREYYR
jgi:hypothetical protein